MVVPHGMCWFSLSGQWTKGSSEEGARVGWGVHGSEKVRLYSEATFETYPNQRPFQVSGGGGGGSCCQTWSVSVMVGAPKYFIWINFTSFVLGEVTGHLLFTFTCPGIPCSPLWSLTSLDILSACWELSETNIGDNSEMHGHRHGATMHSAKT